MQISLTVNTKKTDVLSQLYSAQSFTTSSFTIATESLPNTSRFTYLGSILTYDCDLTEKI